jgi:hypothetical protein
LRLIVLDGKGHAVPLAVYWQFCTRSSYTLKMEKVMAEKQIKMRWSDV